MIFSTEEKEHLFNFLDTISDLSAEDIDNKTKIYKLFNDIIQAADDLLADYKSLADSGDCGFWKVEDIEEWAKLNKLLYELKSINQKINF